MRSPLEMRREPNSFFQLELQRQAYVRFCVFCFLFCFGGILEGEGGLFVFFLNLI